MQHFKLTGSYRLGTELVQVLQTMYPSEYSELQAREGHNTLVLPVVFSRRLNAFYNVSGDFLSDWRLFSHAAQILGIEVLEWVVGARKKPILVLACHLTMLHYFVVYVHQTIRFIIDRHKTLTNEHSKL